MRRAIPAIGLSVVGFFATRFLVEEKLRPHYMHPIHLSWSPTDPTPAAVTAAMNLGSGSWILDRSFISENAASIAAAGGVTTKGMAVTGGCVQSGVTGDALNRCLAANGFTNYLIYQPASRFWHFQAMEFGVFIGLSALLLATAVWWVYRRIG